MKLDDPFLGKAQVHALRVLQVEGTFMELGDRVVRVEQRRLLVHFTNNLEEDGREERQKKSRGWRSEEEKMEIELWNSNVAIWN